MHLLRHNSVWLIACSLCSGAASELFFSSKGPWNVKFPAATKPYHSPSQDGWGAAVKRAEEQPAQPLHQAHLSALWQKKSRNRGTSLVIQWMKLCPPSAGYLGSIPDWGTRSHVPQLNILQLKKKKKKNQSATTKTGWGQRNKHFLKVGKRPLKRRGAWRRDPILCDLGHWLTL